MGKGQDSRLGEEHSRLSLDILREWWLTATQALVDAAGSERALELLKPYFTHMGKAGAINIKSMTGINWDEQPIGAFIQWCAVRGTRGRVFQAGDGTIIFELLECQTKGVCREACICLCTFTMGSGSEEANPKLELVLISSLSSGDPDCKWLSKWKNKPALVAPREEFVRHEFDRLPEAFSDDFADFLGLSMLGEAVVNCTRAFIDFAGPEVTVKQLSPKIRGLGKSIGTMFASYPEFQGKGVSEISEILFLIDKMLQREEGQDTSQERAARTITKCPFSDAPIEVCLQYESLCNGICETINPDYQFTYDRMMTKGEKTCHWTIRKKREQGKDKAKGEAPSDDPAKILAIRYAKGEITKEELEERMENLRKLGLVE
jgi:hypothetical protein